MSNRRQSNILLGVAVFCLVGVPLLLCLFVAGIYSGHSQAALRFLGGFYFFLRENLPRISTNAATWVPGVIAFFLGVAGMHLLFRGRAKRNGLSWRFGTSFALASIFPVLFVIAFLVPGVLLQVQGLSGTRWIFREWGKTDSLVSRVVERYRTVALEHAAAHDGKFPETLAELQRDTKIQSLEKDARTGRHHWNLDLPHEPLIYLGAGLTSRDDGGLVLMISPPFSEDGVRVRLVANIAGQLTTIPEGEVDALIQRSLDARRGAGK